MSDDKHPTPVPTGLAWPWGATLVVMLVIAASVFLLADYLPGSSLQPASYCKVCQIIIIAPALKQGENEPHNYYTSYNYS